MNDERIMARKEWKDSPLAEGDLHFCGSAFMNLDRIALNIPYFR